MHLNVPQFQLVLVYIHCTCISFNNAVNKLDYIALTEAGMA